MDSPSMASRITSKWVGFVTAVWVQAISGNNYTFANYSVALKAILQCNQVQLNNLSVAKDVGKAFGLIAGLLADVLPPWCILLIGSVEGLIGYGGQWLVVSQTIRPLPYWLMSIAMCLGGNSTTWMNTAVLVTCIRNFRRNRGPVSGILKGYVGLSTAIFTDLCAALFTSDPASFVLMLALIPFAICTLAMIFLRPVEPVHSKTEEAEETRGFIFLNAIAIFLACYLLVFDVTGPHSSLVSKIFAGILLFVLAAPMLLPVYLIVKLSNQGCAVHAWGANWWSDLWRHFKNRKAHVENDGIVPLLKDVHKFPDEILGEEIRSSPSHGGELGRDMEEARKGDSANGHSERTVRRGAYNEHEEMVKRKRRPLIGEDHNLIQAMQTIDFWLLFFSFLCGVGTGMAVMNNLGQIGQSLGYSSVSIFISFTSIWGFFGRLGSGALSEFLIRSVGAPRSLVMAMSQLLMIVGYILLAAAVPGSLYIGSIIVGICYGVRLAVSVPTVSELFGLKNFGLMYNILILNLPLGSFLFSGLLAGFLYDEEARKGHGIGMGSFTGVQIRPGAVNKGAAFDMFYRLLGGGPHFSEEALTCLGSHCYRLVFIVMCFVCAVGFVLDVLLTLRTRRLYASLQSSKLSSKK